MMQSRKYFPKAPHATAIQSILRYAALPPQRFERSCVEFADAHPCFCLPSWINDFKQIAALRATDVLGCLFPHRSTSNAAQLRNTRFQFRRRRDLISHSGISIREDGSFAPTQVLVSLVEPVGTWRIENIKIYCVEFELAACLLLAFLRLVTSMRLAFLIFAISADLAPINSHSIIVQVAVSQIQRTGFG